MPLLPVLNWEKGDVRETWEHESLDEGLAQYYLPDFIFIFEITKSTFSQDWQKNPSRGCGSASLSVRPDQYFPK